MGYTDVNGGHSTTSRISVVLAGKVYDVTDFADHHPGGREILVTNNGQDIALAMKNTQSHVHSKAAYTMLEKFYVGILDSFELEIDRYKGLHDNVSRVEEHYKNDIVDWSKPLLEQVSLLGDKYFDWTHQQVARPIRLFDSNLADMMTKAHWWFVPVTWLPIALYYLYLSYGILSRTPELWPPNALGCQLGPVSVPLFAALGIFIWTLLEYTIHRWLFHLRPPSNWPFLIKLHFALHGQHHKSPMDPLKLVFPPLPASIFALLFYAGVMVLFPKGTAYGVFAGILMGYVAYDLTHFYIHHGHPSIAYFQRLKTYHVHHHYEWQQLGFGISSKLWDYPFGTVIAEDHEKAKMT